jgi:hypothetical protein
VSEIFIGAGFYLLEAGFFVLRIVVGVAEAVILAASVLGCSRVRRSLCFALLCDSLSFACPKESKQTKRHPGTAPAAPVHSDTQRRRVAYRTRIALAILKHAVRTGAVRRTPVATTCLRRRATGPEYKRQADTESQLAVRTEIQQHATPFPSD